jgi:uncharacterized protein YqeY
LITLQLLRQELNQALKCADSVRVAVIRQIIAEVQLAANRDRETTLSPHIKRLVRQHEESIDAYKKAKRQDLLDREQLELIILEEYLPRQLEDDEILQIIQETLQVAHASPEGKIVFGNIMKDVMMNVQDRADGSHVKNLVTQCIDTFMRDTIR